MNDVARIKVVQLDDLMNFTRETNKDQGTEENVMVQFTDTGRINGQLYRPGDYVVIKHNGDSFRKLFV